MTLCQHNDFFKRLYNNKAKICDKQITKCFKAGKLLEDEAFNLKKVAWCTSSIKFCTCVSAMALCHEAFVLFV